MRKGFALIFVILVLSLIALIVGGALYFVKTNLNWPQNFTSSQSPNPSSSETATNWESFTGKGYPIVQAIENTNNGKLSIYSLSKRKLIDTDIIVSNAGFGFAPPGVETPVASPDLLYTAYVDTESSSLWILTNETLEKRKITANGGQILISGWSPDNKNLVYFISDGNWRNGIKFDKPDQGYFLHNIQSNVTQKLPFNGFVSFINNQRILTETNTNSFSVFDISTLSPTGEVINKEPYPLSINFTQDGKFWVYEYSYRTLRNGLDSFIKVIYAPFPKKEKDGETIVQGEAFTTVGWPLISPKGSKIAYWRKGKSFNGFIWVYDTKTKSHKQLIKDSRAVRWIDEDTLIIVSYEGEERPYYFFDIKSGKSVKMN